MYKIYLMKMKNNMKDSHNVAAFRVKFKFMTVYNSTAYTIGNMEVPIAEI